MFNRLQHIMDKLNEHGESEERKFQMHSLPNPSAITDPRENDVWRIRLQHPIDTIDCLFTWKEDIPMYEWKVDQEFGASYREQVGVKSGWICTPILPSFEYNDESKQFMYSTSKNRNKNKISSILEDLIKEIILVSEHGSPKDWFETIDKIEISMYSPDKAKRVMDAIATGANGSSDEHFVDTDTNGFFSEGTVLHTGGVKISVVKKYQ
jgi:hypothetical protein